MTDLKETEEKDVEPMLNCREVVLVAGAFCKSIRPRTLGPVTPGMVCEKSNLRRPEAEACNVIEVKILQFKRTNNLLGVL